MNNNNIIPKIAVLISWPREIDMLLPLIKKIPKKYISVIVNNNSIEKGRLKSNKLISILLKKNNINFELFSNIYNKKNDF